MYDETKAKRAVNFFNSLKHTKGKWKGVPFDLLPWQDKVISEIFGTVKENISIYYTINIKKKELSE